MFGSLLVTTVAIRASTDGWNSITSLGHRRRSTEVGELPDGVPWGTLVLPAGGAKDTRWLV